MTCLAAALVAAHAAGVIRCTAQCYKPRVGPGRAQRQWVVCTTCAAPLIDGCARCKCAPCWGPGPNCICKAREVCLRQVRFRCVVPLPCPHPTRLPSLADLCTYSCIALSFSPPPYLSLAHAPPLFVPCSCFAHPSVAGPAQSLCLHCMMRFASYPVLLCLPACHPAGLVTLSARA